VEIRIRAPPWSVCLKGPKKLRTLCELDWPTFGVGCPLEGSIDKNVVIEVYRVISREAWAPRSVSLH
jgi:hypothetical protein